MKILKQILEITDSKTYRLPGKQIELLCVKNQGDNLVMYFTTDAKPDEIVDGTITKSIKIRIVGTGHELSKSAAKYLGTVVMPYGLVWHCFVEV